MNQKPTMTIDSVANEALEALAHAQSIISLMRKTLIQKEQENIQLKAKLENKKK